MFIYYTAEQVQIPQRLTIGIAGAGNSDTIIVGEIRPSCFIEGDTVSAVGSSSRPYVPWVMVATTKMADIVLDRALHAENPRIDRVAPQ